MNKQDQIEALSELREHVSKSHEIVKNMLFDYTDHLYDFMVDEGFQIQEMDYEELMNMLKRIKAYKIILKGYKELNE